MSVAINPDRLWHRLEQLRVHGLTPDNGVTRYVFSPQEKAATQQVAAWMREAGLEVRFDPAGNLFGRLPGRQAGPAVLTGSHLDSVPNGGHFDGPAGVLAALEAVQSIREAGIVPELPIEVVSFVGEEGSRFAWGLMGSSFVAGTFPMDRLYTMTDRDGVTLAEAMRAYGGDPDRVAEARRRPGDYMAYVELHIEQSLALERRGLPVGVVTGIAGMKQLNGVIRGRAEHAGACPMDLRKDPLPAAAELILEAERTGRETGPHTRATVGILRVHPGAANVIPARVEISFDIRDLDAAVRDRAVERISAAFDRVVRARNLEGELLETHVSPPVPCDPAIVEMLEAEAGALGIPVMRLPSGAVHDGANMASLCPIAMIFVRSRDGLSHTPREYSSREDLAEGARLLAAGVLRLSEGSHH